MPNFNTARKNMVDCQIQTSGVSDPRILDAFRNVPREQFVPGHLRGIAFIDEDLPLEQGAFLIDPLTLARMIQVVQPKSSDIVLNIGDTTGYSSAILSNLVSTVVTLEARAREHDAAKPIWSSMDFCNIALVQGEVNEGCAKHAPYDLIIVNGAVSSIPPHLLGQLSEQGRLVAVVRPQPRDIGAITIVSRDGDQAFSIRRTHDAGTPYLPGFEPARSFVF